MARICDRCCGKIPYSESQEIDNLTADLYHLAKGLPWDDLCEPCLKELMSMIRTWFEKYCHRPGNSECPLNDPEIYGSVFGFQCSCGRDGK